MPQRPPPLPLQAAFPQNQPSPLSFARSLLESPTSAYATPSAASTKSVIAADEQSRQNEGLPDAVAAVLAARSQVPRGGNIPALGTSRMTPSTFEAVSTAALPDCRRPRPRQRARTARNQCLDERWARGRWYPESGGTAAAQQFRYQHESAPKCGRREQCPQHNGTEAMMSALDKYETMLQQRRTADDDLAM